MRNRLCGLFIVLLLLGAACGSAQEQPLPQQANSGLAGDPALPQQANSGLAGDPAASEEYRVYEAVLKLLDSIPANDPHVAIYDRTLTSQCDGDGDNPVLVKGCTFLWVKPDTDQDVERMLRRGFHGLERSTWKNFKQRNATSVALHDPLSTPWKHRFTGPDTPAASSAEWQSPDMTIYLSRVGFNSKKTEAIVYVLVFSYVGQGETSGDYLRFRLGPDKSWSLAGHVSYLSQGGSLSASLPPVAHRNPTLASREAPVEGGAATLLQLRPVAELR